MEWERKLCRVQDSDDDLKKIAEETLRGAKIGDKPVVPPIEALAQYAKVKEEPDGLSSDKEKSLLIKWRGAIPKWINKIRGIFDRIGKIYTVDRELHEKKRDFAAIHEIAHDLIPSQKDVVYFEDDRSLSASALWKFDAEANTLAAHLMFKGDQFTTMAEEYELSLTTAKYLADEWGASYHASFRRYVERNSKPCAMFILTLDALKELQEKRITSPNPENIKYIVASNAFREEFGCPKPEETLYPAIAHPELLGQLLIGGVCEGNGLLLSNGKGRVKFNYHAFTNQYEVFLMILPEKRSHFKKKVQFIRA